MKKLKLAALPIACMLLAGCGNATESFTTTSTGTPANSNTENTSSSFPESTVYSEAIQSAVSTQTNSSAVSEPTSSIQTQSETAKTLRDSLSNTEFYDKVKTLGKIAQDNVAKTGTQTLIVFENSGALDITYRTKENQTAALKAMEIISNAPDLVTESEKHDIYKSVYFDWADSSGEKYATWNLTRVGDKLVQDSEVEWFDDEVKAEYDKIMAGDYSALESAATER